MMENTRPPGKTTIAPEVLLTIARLTTLDIKGVSRMSPLPGGVDRIFRRGAGDGVRIEIEDNRVYADLYVILDHNSNMRQVSRNIQQAVARAISETVGMQVGRVNVHIEDIAYPALATTREID
ncbi:MAG: Asp23/Gls24 family envelope stress response protein [Anaerolineales bacterium]|nr:Asp23/Gls24 family envelope stress response protein [Anaerolineales bacterium]